MASHLAEVAIRKGVSAASDAYYEDGRAFGEAAWHAFQNSKAQIVGLESVANGATRVADILDFVKRQTGRCKPQQRWRYKALGENLIEKLDQKVRKDAQTIFETVKRDVKGSLEEDDQRRTHILLCREFIRHLCAHYLYSFGLSTTAVWDETSSLDRK
jgi:hypothetical protein